MELIEHETKTCLRREEAAQRLREIADQLARHNEIEFLRDGVRYTVDVPDEVELEVEIEVGSSSEIELTVSWPVDAGDGADDD